MDMEASQPSVVLRSLHGLCNWHGPGQQPPRKGRPAAPVASPFPQSKALREKGDAAQPLRGLSFYTGAP